MNSDEAEKQKIQLMPKTTTFSLAVMPLPSTMLLLTFWIVQLNKLMVHLGLQTVPWLTYAEAAAQLPFGQGFFVTSMLLSTLLPTLLHLFCAIASIIFVPLRKLS